jgi:hypothetical protein
MGSLYLRTILEYLLKVLVECYWNFFAPIIKVIDDMGAGLR